MINTFTVSELWNEEMDKHTIELRHRAKSNESYEDFHTNFLMAISELDSPWNLKDLEPIKSIGSELLVTLSLNNILGKKFKGRITYMYRNQNYLEDNAQYDDNIFIEFNPGKVDYNEMVKILISYVSAFECYRATIHNWAITKSDWPQVTEYCNTTGKDINGRDGVYRINAINYFDRELCMRAFGLSPEEIINKLNGKVENIFFLNDGVFLIYKSNPLNREGHERVDNTIRLLLM